MKHSYFILFSDRLDCPIYVSICGVKSVKDLREHYVIWNIVRHLTKLDCKSFSVISCTEKSYKNGLIKIDFTFN